MALIDQVRGMLLEEVILKLLRAAGYRTVTNPGDDPTLGMVSAGLTVAGRGAKHQIDAVADYRLGQPFSNPQRLLVETKCYNDNRTVGLPIVRGVVGLLKDVSEYWVARDAQRPASNRYHYQGAIFSSSPFTADAQEYAFAHDICLLPLARSSSFTPVLRSISTATATLPLGADGQLEGTTLSRIRLQLRQRLQPDMDLPIENGSTTWLDPVVESTQEIGQTLVANIGRAFPVFLVPCPGFSLEQLSDSQNVEIYFPERNSAQGWSLHRTGDREPMFTFDLPEKLFALHAVEGVLSQHSAVDVKAGYLSKFSAVYASGDEVRIFTFRLDTDWLARVRASI